MPQDPQYHYTDAEPMTIRQAIEELASAYEPGDADQFLRDLERFVYSDRMQRWYSRQPDMRGE